MASKKGYDPSIRDELKKVDWNQVWIKVIPYAMGKELMLRKIGINLGYKDIIQKAVCRLYGVEAGDKYRNWDYIRYPNMSIFFKFVIKDVVRDEIGKFAKKNSEPLNRKDGSPRDRDFVEKGLDTWGVFDRKSVEELIIDQEEGNKLSSILNEISELDEDLGMVVMCLEDGIGKRRKIAEITGLSKEKVYSKLRRIQRLVRVRYSKIKEIPFLERRVG
jgi:hypothetical protein